MNADPHGLGRTGLALLGTCWKEWEAKMSAIQNRHPSSAAKIHSKKRTHLRYRTRREQSGLGRDEFLVKILYSSHRHNGIGRFRCKFLLEVAGAVHLGT